jgi:hypothetical protein
MTGKRQHYVPRFMLRRFGIDPADKRTMVWRLDKKTGKPERVNPANEAVIGRYYRVTHDDGSVDDSADEILDVIENDASNVIRRVADVDYRPTADHVGVLLLFALTLKLRTPQGREAIHELDANAGNLGYEVWLRNQRQFHDAMRFLGETAEQLDARRLSQLEALKSGRIQVKSTSSREVWIMLSSLIEMSDELFEKLGCVLYRAPDDGKSPFILSDNPVAHYDPDSDDGGAGFLLGPRGGTLVPLDPSFALVFVSHGAGSWRDVALTRKDVGEHNLLTYAWARDAIYGPSQDALTRVRQAARRSPQLLGELAYRPPRLWVGDPEQASQPAGWHTFTSTYRGQTRTRRAFVRPQHPPGAPRKP